jgi:DNA-directed RNA polymerase specialized sigma24 family protein
MMDESGTDTEGLLLRWRQERLDVRDLYAAIREPMHQAARRGIRWITSSDPDPRDVEEAVADAFKQLWDMDPAEVTSVIGLAKTIALRRGQDIGRDVVREREGIKKFIADPLANPAVEFSNEDVRAAEEEEELLGMAKDCVERLPEEHRDLVVHTIMGPETLSDWALRKGKSHQAASKQKRKAVEAIQRCIESKQSEGTMGSEVAP